MNYKKQVYVAISGGVDSAVAAAVLQEQGYDVIGIHMMTWQESHLVHGNKFSDNPALSAKATAESLNIPFVSLDIRERFFHDVVKPFLKDYLAGETPNPCLFCNPQVKWGILQSFAVEQGADYFATGHYARIESYGSNKMGLLRGLDEKKDQSYVLSMLSQSQIRKSLLPLGTWTKEVVRDKALDLGLTAVEQRESQDLCFISAGDYRDFLERYAPEPIQPGDIVNVNGEVVGQHQGLPFYTIGQRKGIRLAAKEPYYVIEKNPSRNLLVVGYAHQTFQQGLIAEKPNWISGVPPKIGEVYEVMVRYRAKPVPAVLSSVTSEEFRLKFNQDVRGITPGQVAVIYFGQACLGGGRIKMAL